MRPASPKQDPKTTSSITRPEIPRRSTTPSPLSKPLDMDTDSTITNAASTHPPKSDAKDSTTADSRPQSPAARQLLEINKKGQGKQGKSRLRRALSFGSAAELKGHPSPTPDVENPSAPAEPLTRKQQLSIELGEEQAAIAEKQEASGLGESIYSSHLFTGSNDNLSVSSTASSASLMLRKMGKGMKKSTRSLVGLFRPKSGQVAKAEPTSGGTMVPQVSMVTVEAQRDEAVSSRRDPTAPGIGGSAQDNSSAGAGKMQLGLDQGVGDRTRQSIVGGENERAEVLAAVRKGILKRESSSSTPVENKTFTRNKT